MAQNRVPCAQNRLALEALNVDFNIVDAFAAKYAVNAAAGYNITRAADFGLPPARFFKGQTRVLRIYRNIMQLDIM